MNQTCLTHAIDPAGVLKTKIVSVSESLVGSSNEYFPAAPAFRNDAQMTRHGLLSAEALELNSRCVKEWLGLIHANLRPDETRVSF